MKEKLTQFEKRQQVLTEKLNKLSNTVDLKLLSNQRQLLDKLEAQKQGFEATFREQVDAHVKKLKYLAELEYNFKNMITDIIKQRENDVEWMKKLTVNTINDDNVVY